MPLASWRGRLPIATEVELKLAAAVADLPTLERALLDQAPGAEVSRRFLTTTYYDTPDLELRRRGLTLRVREADGRFVQTVKSDPPPAGGILERGEWEDAITGAHPDLGAPSGSHLPDGIEQRLRPLFATAVRRTLIDFEDGEARIEAAFDKGEIRGIAAVSAAPISEVELELKGGAAGALFDAALRLLETAPLHLETRAKAQRGYALLASETAPAAVHAEPLALDPAMSIDSVLQTLGRVCLAQLLRNQPAALAGDTEGIHQMRVALRRIGSALSTFKPMLPVQQRRWASGQAASLDEALGPARDLDVFAGDLLPPGQEALPDVEDLDRLAAAVETARHAAHARAAAAIGSPGHTQTMLQLLRWFETRGWREAPSPGESDPLAQPIGDVAPLLLDRCRRSLRKRSKGFRGQSAKQRHRLRIALKRLRYTAEMFTGLFDARDLRNLSRRLKQLQDDLGHASDLATARDLLRGLSAGLSEEGAVARAGKRLLDWHERALAKTEPETREHLRELTRAEPFWRR